MSERVCEKNKIKYFFSIHEKKSNTGGRFRSYGLWVVIHNHPQVEPEVVERKRTEFNSALPLRHTGEDYVVTSHRNDGELL